MNCKYCNKQIEDSSEFCPYCGKNQKEPKKKKSHKVRNTVVALLVAAAVCVPAGFYVVKNMNKEPATYSTSTSSSSAEKKDSKKESSENDSEKTKESENSESETKSTSRLRHDKCYKYIETRGRCKAALFAPPDFNASSKTDHSSDTNYCDIHKNVVFTDFSDEGIVGIGSSTDGDLVLRENAYCVNPDNNAFAEMNMGLKAKIKDNRYLEVESYENKLRTTCDDIKIMAPFKDDDNTKFEFDKNTGKLTADLYDTSYYNGVFSIIGEFKYGDPNGYTYQCVLPFIIDCSSDSDSDFQAYICQSYENFDTAKKEYYVIEGNKELMTLTPSTVGCFSRNLIEKAGISLETGLTGKEIKNGRDDCIYTNIMYPSEVRKTTQNFDTDFWKKMSQVIIKNGVIKRGDVCTNNENKSKEYKAFLLYDWCVQNLTYDQYQVDKYKDDFTPRYDENYNEKKGTFYTAGANDEYYMSSTNVGVCRDFAFAYAIMCRVQDIPCVILSTDEHVWNAVFINGKWQSVDLTSDVITECNSETITSKKKRTKSDKDLQYKSYCHYKNVPTYVNHYVYYY